MKLTRYIRPSATGGTQDQLDKTDRDGISTTIIEGEQGRTFENALQQLGPNNHLLIRDLKVLARKKDDVATRIKQVVAKGASIVEADGFTTAPNQAAALIRGIKSKGITVRGGEPKPRVPHNKTPDAVKEAARRMYTQQKFKRWSNKEIAEEFGVTTWALRDWFGPRSKYIDTVGPGRPRGT
jgi:hypothetical protein